MKHLTLKRIREQKHLSREIAAKLIGIKTKTLEDIEEYRLVPEDDVLRTILKMLGFGYIEIFYVIYEDINKKYKPESKTDKNKER